MTRRNARIQGWAFPLFSSESDDRLSPNFHRFVILYRSCNTRSVGLGQYCLPKGSNGFNPNTILSQPWWFSVIVVLATLCHSLPVILTIDLLPLIYLCCRMVMLTVPLHHVHQYHAHTGCQTSASALHVMVSFLLTSA